MELDPVKEGVVTDGAGVGGSPTEGLQVSLARAAQIGILDGGEGDELARVDLDLPGSDAVAAAGFHLRPAPQPERDRDEPGQHVVAQLFAELHEQTLRQRRLTVVFDARGADIAIRDYGVHDGQRERMPAIIRMLPGGRRCQDGSYADLPRRRRN